MRLFADDDERNPHFDRRLNQETIRSVRIKGHRRERRKVEVGVQRSKYGREDRRALFNVDHPNLKAELW